MKKLITLTAFTLMVVRGYSNSECYKKYSSYYWRDYLGDIPEDALLAGKIGNESIYIGQVYIKDYELLPATIDPILKIATTTAFGKVFHVTEYVKILCGRNLDGFKWLKISSDQLSAVQSSNHLVPGGSEVGENLFISRNGKNGFYIIGKVFRHGRQNRGSWYWFDKSHVNALSYEVLSYDCSKDTPDIDPRFSLEK